MLKASALYMVIIIALVIGVICSSLIASAYFYRAQYQKTARYSLLQNNLTSGINILLAGDDTTYEQEKTFSLFQTETDTVTINRIFWGLYDIGTVKAFIQKDTLYQSLSIAHTLDSGKWAVLYLPDDERPLAVSGKTRIKGNVFIPPAGVNQAYIDNQAYSGDKRLIIGKIQNSQKTLPALNAARLEKFKELLDQKHDTISILSGDTLQNSFLQATRVFSFRKKVTTLQNICLKGNIILFSDTTLTIDSTASLTNVLVFARSIIVKSGFRGQCQLYATDTIGVGQRALFSYPSCLGILRFGAITGKPTEAKINLQSNCSFSGLIFTYEKAKNVFAPLIDIGKNTKIKGQVYSQGLLEFHDQAEVDGSVFTATFLYQTSFTRYENYINNTTLDESLLSPYYLTSDLVPVAASTKKILQWLDLK